MAYLYYSSIDLFSEITSAVVQPENIRFRVVLTGDADGLSDYEYPLASYSGTHYTSQTSYLNFVLPYSTENLTAYNDRPNGEIQLYRIATYAGNTGETLIAVGNPQSNNFYKGAINSSLTISATKQVTNSSPKTYPLENIVSITRNTDDQRVFEVAGYNDITAGDSFTYGAETIIAEQVMILISATKFTYKIKEQL